MSEQGMHGQPDESDTGTGVYIVTGIDALRWARMPEDGIPEFMASVREGLRADDYRLELQATSLGPILQVRVYSHWYYDPHITIEFVLQPAGSAATARMMEALPGYARKHAPELIGSYRWRFFWNDEDRTWHRVLAEAAPPMRAPFDFDQVVELAAGAGALWVLGKLADAYISRLADLIAESTFEAVRRIKLKRRLRDDFISIEIPQGATAIVLPRDGLSDEARLAFIDLDLTAEGICGKTLYWDPAAQSWIPGPEAGELRHRSGNR